MECYFSPTVRIFALRQLTACVFHNNGGEFRLYLDICYETVQKPLLSVLVAIGIGALLGHFYPELGAQMKPPGDGFVKLIKMSIAPVIFCTVVTGIAGMESMKTAGRTGAALF